MLTRHMHGTPAGLSVQAEVAMARTNNRPPDAVDFNPLNDRELNKTEHNTGHTLAHFGLAVKHRTYPCGACGKTTNGRVLCEATRRSDSAHISWCWCSCDNAEPTVIVEKEGRVITQLPNARDFSRSPDWPTNLAELYDEAAKSYAAGAYTATTMVCRKLLMAIACDKGETDGKKFTEYVDHITNKVLVFPDAKTPIDAIRTIGNEATHEVKIVNQPDATRAMKIVTYTLNTIYSLPAA